ncbi:MAG: hypothetical protein WCO48_02855 [Candidatus Taylorbacteria bacterium]
MPRRVEDIKPSNRRSIRDIPIRLSTPKKEIIDTVVHTHTPVEKPHHSTKKPTGLRWFLITIGVLIIFSGLGYIASTYFSRASFTITPVSMVAEIDGIYSTQDSSSGLTTASGTIPYSLMTVRGSASTTVSATVGPAVSTKSQGPVTLYNSYSTQSQKLIAGTRMANSSGRVYRLAGSVVIPGYTVSSKTTIPGSVNATIIADQPGDLYNITGASSISDFKMVSYKGTTKYDSIYARISAPIVGGMTGTQSIISTSVMSSSTSQLKTTIIADLLKQIHSVIPVGYIMYDSGYISSFSTTTSPGVDKAHGVVTVQGTVSGMLFKKSDLVNRLASAKTVSSFSPFKYDTSSLESLNVQIINDSTSTKSKVSSPIISMKVKGTIKLVGIVPVEEVVKKILGKTSEEAQKIFKQYSQVIDKVEGDVMPQWSNVPMNPSRVSVVVK